MPRGSRPCSRLCSQRKLLGAQLAVTSVGAGMGAEPRPGGGAAGFDSARPGWRHWREQLRT